MLIKDIMKKNVFTVEKDASLGTCVKIMAEKKVGSVVIVENDKPIDIVTESDVVKGVWLFNSIDVSVKNVLKKLKGRKLVTVPEDTTYYQCFQMLRKHDVKHLVIVDENGYLKGIVSCADFIEFLNDFSVKDHLTSVYNKRFLEFTLGKFKVEGTKFSVIFIDLDNFKKINDNYGHRVGDILLKEIARFFQKYIRSTDILVRFGGDEFIILALNTPEEGAKHLAQRLFDMLAQKTWDILRYKIEIRFSAGIASNFSKDFPNIWNVIEAADKALYQAKTTGRGKVCIYNEKMAGGKTWNLN